MALTGIAAAAQAVIANQGQLDALQNQLNGIQGQMTVLGRTMVIIGLSGLLASIGLPKIISYLANQYFNSQMAASSAFNITQFTLSPEEQEKLLDELRDP
jgi:formate-dependent nitrite reductase membrane component NrfD